MYHYAGESAVRFVDPDGRQVAPPMVLPRGIAWAIPKYIPVPIPAEVCPLPFYIDPRLNQKGGKYYFEKAWDGDWNHALSGPDMNDPNSNPLGDDWEPDKSSNSKDKSGMHKLFKNKKTGETVRWDEDGQHWHRLNPDKNTKNDFPYLDPKGNPSKKQSPDAHIKPNPVYIYVGSIITKLYLEVDDEKAA